MSDLATALMQALGIGKNAPPQAPPNTAKDPWNDPSLAPKPMHPMPGGAMMAGASHPGGQGGPGPQGGSGDELDALLAEIVKQKQMAAGATGNPIPRP